ncbi:cbb3-type cytochrome c oxidase subunit I [Roseateles sp.]|uniref:cbb3-type cytochrome c oxidase subunit I n=1 Tax=Roseateles sp. TaxID=1971397 RepID=UPI00286A6A84|nr:cbb3-type cytochrome c oxidase subunit I [Roseateles sp.]
MKDQVTAMPAGKTDRWDLPMLYIFGVFFVFVLGGLTGVMLAMVPFDCQAHDSHFVVAHLHYVVAGAFLFPMLAGLYYWLPLLTGRATIKRLSVPAFWLILVGFNLTFLLMYLVGLLLIDLLIQLRYGRRSKRDPWQATTLEWAMPMPPPSYNFASILHLEGHADALSPATLGVHMSSGQPDQLIVLPKSTYLPLWTGLAAAKAVLAMLAKAFIALVLILGPIMWPATCV